MVLTAVFRFNVLLVSISLELKTSPELDVIHKFNISNCKQTKLKTACESAASFRIMYSCDAVVRPHALFSATSTFAHKALSTHCIARNMHSNCAGLNPR